MTLAATQRRPYNASDRPEYGEIGHGPWCLGLPTPKMPVGYTPLEDGSDLDNPGHR
jgi:phospholipid/cholesterol/gamma-HCH transport system substrate-binding protein